MKLRRQRLCRLRQELWSLIQNKSMRLVSCDGLANVGSFCRPCLPLATGPPGPSDPIKRWKIRKFENPCKHATLLSLSGSISLLHTSHAKFIHVSLWLILCFCVAGKQLLQYHSCQTQFQRRWKLQFSRCIHTAAIMACIVSSFQLCVFYKAGLILIFNLLF